MPEYIECPRSDDKAKPMHSIGGRRWVYPHLCDLPGEPLAGEGHLKGQCVQLVQKYLIGLGNTLSWRFENDAVLDSEDIRSGTVIGNQKNGRWPGLSHGNHVGIFLRYGGRNMATGKYSGFYIVEQFVGCGDKVQVRFLRDKGRYPDGRFRDPPNNAAAFFALKK